MSLNLILSIPQGAVTATSLGIDGFAWHRSPGSGKFFHGRSIFVDLALAGDRPAFKFLDEGGWRDANADALSALEAVKAGKRTKTALSNNAFSATPVDAYKSVHIVKTGGETLAMERSPDLVRFEQGACPDGITPDQIAKAAGLAPPRERHQRLYMVFAPLEFILLSNLTPQEYVWYATHRRGKIFRQVLFTELRADQAHLAAEAVFLDARRELSANANKKTKTVMTGEGLNRTPFSAWVGYQREAPGGIYFGDREKVGLWQFPERISRSWERAG